MYIERQQKEIAKMVKDLNEEIPPQTNVWCKVWHEQAARAGITVALSKLITNVK